MGSFIFSQGLVAGPRLSQRSFVKTLRSVFIVLVVGFLRLYFTKTVGYHERTIEYGVHWNFFFTLAFIPLLVYLLTRLFARVDRAVVGMVVLAVYEYCLQKEGLQEFILDSPRVDFISMNKEGIFSFVGKLDSSLNCIV